MLRNQGSTFGNRELFKKLDQNFCLTDESYSFCLQSEVGIPNSFRIWDAHFSFAHTIAMRLEARRLYSVGVIPTRLLNTLEK